MHRILLLLLVLMWLWDVSGQFEGSLSTLQFGGSGDETIIDAVSDDQGNSYILGTFNSLLILGDDTLGDIEIGPRLFLAKLDPTENWVWAQQIAFSSRAWALALHPQGGLVVLGGFNDGLVTKYNADASEVEWIAGPQTGTNAMFSPGEIVVDGSGNINCSILVNSTYTIWDGITTPFTGDMGTFIGKLGPDHELQWAQQIGLDGSTSCWSYETVVTSLLLDGSDGIWVSGQFGSDLTFINGTYLPSADGLCSISPFIMHETPDGTMDQLLGLEPGTGNGSNGWTTHSCINDGHLLYLDCFGPFVLDGHASDGGAIGAHIDQTGCIGIDTLGGWHGEWLMDVLSDEGLLFIAGEVRSDVNTSSPYLSVRQNGAWQILINEMDTIDESMACVNRIGPDDYRAFGFFANGMMAPDNALASGGERDCFVLRIVPDQPTVVVNTDPKPLGLAVDPDQELLWVTSDGTDSGPVLIHDASGRLVIARQAQGRATLLSAGELPTGLYLVKCGKQAARFIKY